MECVHPVQDGEINRCTLFKRKHQEVKNAIAVSWPVSEVGYDGEVDIRLTFILLIFVCFLLGNSPASEFYMPTFRNTLSVPSS